MNGKIMEFSIEDRKQTKEPGYKYIARMIRENIRRSNLKPGQKIWSESQLAKYFKMSSNTIKKALDLLVHEDTLYRQQGKGSFIKQRKVIAESAPVGLVFKGGSSLVDDFFALQVLQGVKNELSGGRLEIIFKEDSVSYTELVGKYSLRGAIIMWPALADKEDLRELSHKLPVVSVSSHTNDPDIPYVALDNVNASYEATLYLLERGHRNIVFVCGGLPKTAKLDRERGFITALDSYRIDSDKLILKGKNWLNEESGNEIVSELLSMKPLPTAIVAWNDLVAIGIIKALKRKGKRVPGDFDVIGFGDSPASSLVDPSLTSVAGDLQGMGAAAAKLLKKYQEASGGDRFVHTILPVKLIIRESTEK